MKKVYGALVTAVGLMCAPVYADSFGVRGAVSESNTDEDFEAGEVFVVLDLPWGWGDQGLRAQTQFELSAGALHAADETGFIGTLGPRMAFTSGSVTLDLGLGVAGLGETGFGEQDFAGSTQFIAHAGLAFALTRRFNIGVRYRHMSDAETHEEDGEDLNLVLLEASYDFRDRR